MASDSPIEFQRDFRNTEWRRFKTQDIKWSRGARPSPGVRLDFAGEPITGSDRQKELHRPLGKFSDHSTPPKREHNIVKPRTNFEMPSGRVRNKIYAQKEISDAATSRSLVDLASPISPKPLARNQSVSETSSILYSFDRTDTPGLPVTLDIFVKTNGRETERLIEKEYEVIDANGEPLKGKKARRNLRKAVTDPGTALGPPAGVDDVVEDEGFELV